jgi:membrane protein YqaA with SNARE-associated domain
MTLLRTAISSPISNKRRLPISSDRRLPVGSDRRLPIRENAGRFVALLLVLTVSVGILLAWEQIQSLGAYGYPAIFLVSLFGNAILFLPAPSFALVLAAGASLDPLLVGVVAGTGAAIGEMTGYLAGYSGQAVVQDRPLYNRIRGWMSTNGILAIFIFAAIPNPFFDIGGIFAGVMRLPAWQFLFATWLGKSLRFALLAGLGVLAAS